ILITVGRLTKQKGQWYLLRIFKELKKEFPELKLLILGEGELKEYLTGLSKDLGLKTYVWDKDQLSENFDVYFLGFQKNPFKFIARSKLFVFPSLWEGFGNVLIESMACGTAVVSADCRSGPREILAPNTDFEYQTKEPEYAEYGILMPTFKFEFKNANEPLDEIEMVWVKVIDDLLKREELRKRYAAKAVERAKHFDINLISNQWSQILYKISTGGM
ncbi:MAG: glycosyltransferase, partial [Nitrososphaeria archaeon]